MRVALLSLAIGFLAYWFYFHFATSGARKLAASPDAEMQWLRQEFALNDQQYNRIVEMHDAYAQHCGEMCGMILQSRAKLQTLLEASHGAVTPEIKAALANASAAELDCRQSMLDHIFAVSRVMSPENGERYREMMEQHIVQGSQSHMSLAPAAK